MLVEHRGMRPEVDPNAWIAPTAVLCGDGPQAHVNGATVGTQAFIATGADDLMARVMPRQTAWLAPHRDDREL